MTISYSRSNVGKLLFGLFLLFCSQSLQILAQDSSADDSTPGATSPASRQFEPQVGETSGERRSREWLESRGISFETIYRAEAFSNLRGGTDGKRGGEYLGSADASLTFDLAKLHIGRGAIVVSGQSLHGQGINDRKVGAVQAASNLDDVPFNKLIEAYFTDSILHRRLTFKVGRLYSDADFNVIENGADFLNSSYGSIPTVPMPTYPSPQFGATLWTALTSRISVGAGIYHAQNIDSLDESASPVSTGTFTILETKVDPFSRAAAFHGSYRVGVWQQGKSTWNANNLLTPVRTYGVYGTGDHWFRKPLSSGGNVGPGVFFQVGWSPSDRNEIKSYWGVGAAYPGFVPTRSNDSIGIGVTQARLAVGRETVVEAYYKIQLTKRVFVQPDAQWVNRPAGDGHDALLGGLRLGVSF